VCFTLAVENSSVIAREGAWGLPPGEGEIWKRNDSRFRDTNSVSRGKAYPQDELIAPARWGRTAGSKGLAQ
jgi:hypothetical protein